MRKVMVRYLAVVTKMALACAFFIALGCSTVRTYSGDLPPVLAQDELLRPYQKVAELMVTRQRFGSPSDLSPADYTWGYDALRGEAAKIGADAVIFPEITVELDRYVLFPSSEMKAKGIAIKFR
jgi:hypothetical protein